MQQAAPKPPAESMLDADRGVRSSWQLYFNNQNNYQQQFLSDFTQMKTAVQTATTAAGTANTNATAAVTAAASARTAAASAQARITALLAGSQLPAIGDYRESIRATVGSEWLVCDGSLVSNTAYPDLYALIGSTTGPGEPPDTFKLPLFAPVYGPYSGSVPIKQTFIKAL